MKQRTQLSALTCAALTQLAGCAVGMDEELGVDDVESVAATEEAIRGGLDVPVGSRYAKTTVALPNCTATIIGQRHALTAAHCAPAVDSVVTFFDGAVPNPSVTRTVLKVYAPWGVSPTDFIDNDGKWADYMVLQLSPIPAGYVPAKVAVTWPGNWVSMVQVGRGAHDGLPNPNGFMRYRTTNSYSASNANGHVLVEASLDPGDSGGPLYTNWGSTVLTHGVTHGNVFEWAWRGMYISTAFHFWDIAKAVGLTKNPNWNFPGNDIVQTENVSLAECASLCLANTACRAYTLTTLVPGGTTSPEFGRCYQKSSAGGTGVAANGRFSGAKGTTGICDLSGGYCRL